MGLNIKNDEVCRLAREVARRTGQTQTAAIARALEAELARLVHAQDAQAAARAARVRAIVAEFHDALPADGRTSADLVEELYDAATGLPR